MIEIQIKYHIESRRGIISTRRISEAQKGNLKRSEKGTSPHIAHMAETNSYQETQTSDMPSQSLSKTEDTTDMNQEIGSAGNRSLDDPGKKIFP